MSLVAAPLLGIRLLKVTPAEMDAWRGPEIEITQSSPRIPAERKWYAVTGRVVGVQVENDGDLHLVMENTNGAIYRDVDLGDVFDFSCDGADLACDRPGTKHAGSAFIAWTTQRRERTVARTSL